MTDDKTARIAALNDRLRRHGQGGRILLTPGLMSRGLKFLRKVIAAVRSFEAFDPANDPYAERDFGAVSVDGRQIFFKIDYYAPDLQSGSQDPADEACCVRVLTIMLAEEY